MLWWETPRETVERWEFKAQRTHEECNQSSLLADRWTILLCDCGKSCEPRRLCSSCWSYPLHPVEVRLTSDSALHYALRNLA